MHATNTLIIMIPQRLRRFATSILNISIQKPTLMFYVVWGPAL